MDEFGPAPPLTRYEILTQDVLLRAKDPAEKAKRVRLLRDHVADMRIQYDSPGMKAFEERVKRVTAEKIKVEDVEGFGIF